MGTGMGHRGLDDAYGEGERVFAPPQGTFDPAWVARLLLEGDPGLPAASALARVRQAWELLVDLVAAGEPADRLALGAGLVETAGLTTAEADDLARLVLEVAVAYDAMPG